MLLSHINTCFSLALSPFPKSVNISAYPRVKNKNRKNETMQRSTKWEGELRLDLGAPLGIK